MRSDGTTEASVKKFIRMNLKHILEILFECVHKSHESETLPTNLPTAIKMEGKKHQQTSTYQFTIWVKRNT